MALRSFAADPSTFANLFVAFETIKQRGQEGESARKRGHQYIVDNKWATAQALNDFYETARLRRHGKPNYPIKAGCREIGLDQGPEPIRELLARWAKELVP